MTALQRLLGCFIVFVIALSAASAQGLRFTQLSTEQGLSTRYCWSAVQDHYGYVWVSTQFGLNRWDGVHMKRYQQNGDSSQLPLSNVYDVLESKAGTLWLACLQGGLARYNRAKENFSTFRPDASQSASAANTVVSLSEGRDGRIWMRVAEHGVVYSFDPHTSQFRRYAAAGGSAAFSMPICFHEDKNAAMWIGTDRGLFRADEASGTLVPVGHDNANPAMPGPNAIVSLNEDLSGHLLIGSSGHGLYVLDNPSSGHCLHFSQLSSTPDAGADVVISILRTAKGQLVALCEDATGKGTALAYLNESALLNSVGAVAQRIALNQSPGCSLESNTQLFEDPTGMLWINGNAGALSYNPADGSSHLYTHSTDDPESICGPMVRSIFADRSGALWFVTRNDGVCACFPPYRRMATLTDQLTTPSDRRLLAPTVSRFTEDHDGNVWIGYYLASGISKYNRKTGSMSHILHTDNPGSLPATASNTVSVFDFFCDNDGSMWIATSAGLAHMNTQSGECQNFHHSDADAHSLSSDAVQCVLRDKSGTLWVATRRGLNSLDASGSSFTSYVSNPADEHSLAGNDVRVIFQDRDGWLWFGGDGLTSYNPSSKQWQRYKVNAADSNAMMVGFVQGILDAEPGFLWVNDARGGLCKLDKSNGNFQRLAKKLGLPTNTAGLVRDSKGVLWMNGESSGAWTFTPANGEVHVYGKGFGLPSMDAVDRALYQTRDGEMWIGTTRGIAHFYPDSLERNPYKPTVVISEVRNRNQRLLFESFVADAKSIELKHDQNDITFEFAALSYLHAEDNRYKYRLEGYDQEWTDCGTQREAKYTNLPPGTYHFRVMACNNDNVWNEEGADLEVVILPPWWATWWARLLFVVVLVGGSFSAYRWRIRSIRLRNTILERQVQERTHELSVANEEIKVQAANVQKKAHDLEQALTELQQTQAELVQSEKMAALGQLVAGIAHEVNTPLGAIKAAIGNIKHASDEVLKTLPDLIKTLNDQELAQFLDLVQSSVKSQNTPTGREARTARRAMTEVLTEQQIQGPDHCAEVLVEMGLVECQPSWYPLLQRADSVRIIDCAYNLSLQARQSSTIEVAVERASKVVFALKTYAHYDHRNEKQAVNVTNTMEVVMTLYHNTLKHGIELHRDFDTGLPEIQAYGDELTQVWTNLVHNAIQAMSGKGHMTLGIHKRKAGPQVSGATEMIEVSVGDSGGGIPEEIREKIFNPFFTTKPAGEGSGLGLDICKKIIEKHNGSIRFESEMGKGTTFFVYLPV